MNITKNNAIIPDVPSELLIARWDILERENAKYWTMVAVGDIGLSGKTALHVERIGKPAKLFGDLAPIINGADCSFGNLETPLLDNLNHKRKLFAGKSKWASGLAEVGFDVLHMAGNHMLDFGAEGFAQTIKAVKNSGITIVGAGDDQQQARQLVVQDIRNTRVGWLAAGHTNYKQPLSPQLWELNVEELIEATQQARQIVDVLIISLHWGPMLVDYPYLEQYQAAHHLVDNGASAIIMHHAHILQPVEIYKDVPICYGLGNCIFDVTEGESQKAKNFTYYKYFENQTSALFYFIWQNNKCIGLTAIPFCLPEPDLPFKDSFRLSWPDEVTGSKILDRLERISKDIKTNFSDKLQTQLQIIWKRELSINICLILHHFQFWRIWYLIRSIRPRHIIAMFRIFMLKIKNH